MAIKHLIRQLSSNQDSFKLTGSGLGVRDKLSKVGLDTSAKSFRLGGRTKASSVNLGTDRDAKTTTQAVNNAIGNGDVMLMDTRQVYFRRPVTRSAINIYNPRKVEIGAGGGGSKDQTTEAERREEELEARRRRRRMALLTGGAAGGAAAAASSGGGGGGGGDDDAGTSEEEESSFDLMETLTDALGVAGGLSLVGGMRRAFGRLLNFRKSWFVRGAAALAGLRGGRTTAPPTPRGGGGPAPRTTTAPKPVFDPKTGRYRDPTTGRFAKAPTPTPTVKPSATTRLGGAAKAVGSGVARTAGTLTRLAGGPVGIGLIAGEAIAREYLRRLQESTGAQDVANASHAVRRGNEFFTSDGQSLGGFGENDPGFVRSIVEGRANLINNTLTIVGAVRNAKEAFLLDEDSTASMYLKAIPLLQEERARIAGRLGGVMLAENLITSPGQMNILGRLSPGEVGGVNFNLTDGLDQQVQRDLDIMRDSLSFYEVFDKQAVDFASGSLQMTDVNLIRETLEKRRSQYEAAKAAQGIEPTQSSMSTTPPATTSSTATAPATAPVVINNNSTAAPSLPENKLDTRGAEAKDIRDHTVGNGQMTGSPGLD